MIKVIVSDKLSQEGVKILQEAGFQVDCKFGISPDELKQVIGQYQGIVIRSGTTMTADIIEKADNLKVIGRAGVGVDNVDVEAATKKGILVMNAPGGNTLSTCEQAFALMLSVARGIPFAHLSVKNKQWERSKFKGTELYGKTLGIVGLGRIGKEVAQRAIAFGMRVVVYDPFVTPELAERIGVELIELNRLIREADFITVHTPLTDETRNLIAGPQFALMKKGAFVINCARGGIVNEDALYEALRDKKIAGAALDVYVNEPPTGSKLLELDNLVMTPHLGASTEEAQVNVAIEVAYCLRDALQNKAIKNAVNYAQLDPETYKVIGPYFGLAEKMGKFISQLIEGRASEIQISYIGEISTYKVDVLGAALVKGFFSLQLEDDINDINALEIAKARGLKVEQVKIREEKEYLNAIRLRVITDKGERLLEGALFADRSARFVKMDDVYIEIAPSTHMVVITNKDKPGVIGFLGTTLGEHKINIANMSLGRRADKSVALTILNVDTPIDKKVIGIIQSNPNVISLKTITL